MLLTKKFKSTITVISVAIPIAVAILIYLPARPQVNFDLTLLPAFHCILNSLTSILLLVALYAILNKKIQLHKISNLISAVLSSLFLVSYVIYHLLAESTKYGDLDKNGIVDANEKLNAGSLRYVYYFILLSHILLAVMVVPFVLYSFTYAYLKKFEKHKKLSKYTWAIWFYVSATGVIVYLMIKNYY